MDIVEPIFPVSQAGICRALDYVSVRVNQRGRAGQVRMRKAELAPGAQARLAVAAETLRGCPHRFVRVKVICDGQIVRVLVAIPPRHLCALEE